MSWTRWYGIRMSNEILTHTLSEFAVVSKLVYRSDFRRIYDTKNFYVREGWNETNSGHKYYTCSCTYNVVKYQVWYMYLGYIFGVSL